MSKIFRQKILRLAEFMLTVQYKDVKRISLRVKPDGEIFLSAPLGVSDAYLQNFAAANLEWLRAKEWALRQRDPALHYDMSLPFSGSEVYLQGKRLSAEFFTGALENYVQVLPDKVNFYAKRALSEAQRAAFVKELYRQQLEKSALPLLNFWQQRLGVHYSGLRLRLMKSRWGTCNVRTGQITLNLLLACWPQECLEYIVVHELTHLIVADHSARFHALVEKVLPDWKQRKKMLREFKPLFNESSG